MTGDPKRVHNGLKRKLTLVSAPAIDEPVEEDNRGRGGKSEQGRNESSSSRLAHPAHRSRSLTHQSSTWVAVRPNCWLQASLCFLLGYRLCLSIAASTNVPGSPSALVLAVSAVAASYQACIASVAACGSLGLRFDWPELRGGGREERAEREVNIKGPGGLAAPLASTSLAFEG